MQSTLKLSITPELSALNSALDKVNKRASGIRDIDYLIITKDKSVLINGFILL